MNIHFDYSGKIALVTGSATGMGKEMALQFAKAGASVALWDMNDQEGIKTAEACRALGVKAQYFHVDVSDEEGVYAAAKQTLECFGGLDYLISNAGIGPSPKVKAYEEGYAAETRRVFSVNVFGSIYVMQAFMEHFKARRQGKIVVTSSIAHRIPSYLPGYAASKAALSNLVRNAAMYLGDYNVNVNAIEPGHVFTPIYKEADVLAKTNPDALEAGQDARGVVESRAKKSALQRIQTVEDMAYAVLFLCADEACNITGMELCVDAGFSVR